MTMLQANVGTNRRSDLDAPYRFPGFATIAPPPAGDSVDLELLRVPAVGPRKGPPVLFVHGMYHGAWCWREKFMPFFAGHGYDTFAVSFRDHGNSSRTANPESWHLADYIKDVDWAVRQIGRKPILIGHSMGGTIVQKMLEVDDYPGVALLAPSPVGGSNKAALRMVVNHPMALTRALSRRDLGYALPAFLDSFFSPSMPAEQVHNYALKMTGRTSFAAAEDTFFKDCARPQPKASPVLVLAGSRDWSIPIATNKALAEAWGGEFQVAPSAHDLMLDVEWEKAAEIVLDWMRRRVT